MKKIFTVLALFISTFAFAQRDVSDINIYQNGFKASYSTGDTIIIYFTNISSVTDKDSVLIQWYTTASTSYSYYRVNLGDSKSTNTSLDYTYVAKFILPGDFLSGSRIRIGVASTPKINTDGISAVVSPIDIEKKEIAISIYSITGQFIKNATSLNYKESLPEGIYLFLSTDQRIPVSGKFMIK